MHPLFKINKNHLQFTQQKNGLGPAIKKYLNGNNPTADDLTILNNAACSLEKAITDTITDAIFV